MFHLDYVSCFLTVVSTVMVGRQKWHGWMVAGINSIIICVIGLKTGQIGFVPANLFCLGLYTFNIFQWRRQPTPGPARRIASGNQHSIGRTAH